MEARILKLQILSLIFCLFYSNSNSQEPYQKLLWGSNFNSCKGVTPAWDSGFIFSDRTLAKISSSGNVDWAKNYKVNTWLVSVARTFDGGYIATGTVYFINNGNHKIISIKVDATGNLIWNKLYGGTDDKDEWGYSICQTRDSNYIIAGTTTTYGMGANDIYLIKIDKEGNFIWAKTIGEEHSETVYRIKQDNDGNLLVIGYTFKTSNNADIYLVKLNESGDTIWTKTYGGSYHESGHDVIQTSDGGYAILGTSGSIAPARLVDVALIKTDIDGNLIWGKTYGGYDVDEGSQLWELPDHGFILSGQTESFGSGGDCPPIGPCRDYYLIRTDQYGDTVWTKAYGLHGSQEWTQGVLVTEDEGFVIFGQSETLDYLCSYLVKTDSDGYCPCNSFSTNTIVANAVFEVSSRGRTSHGIIVSSTSTAVLDIDIELDSSLCLPVGIQEQVAEQVTIYPNPATANLHIDLPGKLTGQQNNIKLYDQLGRELISSTLPPGTYDIDIDLSGIPNGIYVLRIFNSDADLTSRKIVINK